MTYLTASVKWAVNGSSGETSQMTIDTAIALARDSNIWHGAGSHQVANVTEREHLNSQSRLLSAEEADKAMTRRLNGDDV